MNLTYDDLLDLTDEELCGLAGSGSREAENILAERYLYIVRASARPYFLAGGDSEDLIQEGMLGLLSAIREYNADRGAFAAFASRCVRNRIISSARAAGREKHAPLNNYLALDNPELSDSVAGGGSADPERMLLERESYLETLGEFRRLLSPLEDEILSLYLEGLTTAEMAQRLDRKPKSVENAIARMRRKLARHAKLRQ